MPPATRRAAAALLILALLLAAPRPARTAAQSGPALSSLPSALEVTLPLGSTRQASFTLRNDSSAALAPRLFEAHPATGRAFAASAQPARVPLPAQPARVDPQLSAELAASSGGSAEFLVFLADQADLSAAYAIADWDARGAYVYQTLREHAEATQAELRAALGARELPYTPLWIVNALLVRGSAADVAAIAARAEVAELRANRTAALEAGPAQIMSSTCNPDAANTCWNIARMGASRVWSDFGVRGEGIVVANIDSGVRFDHPALIGQYRGSAGATVDHNYSWYDPYGASATPVDSGNHGTHTMGSMVARGLSAAQPAVGVAPGARWIAARACGALECAESDLILAAQWMLAPTDLAGNSPRPDLRPHVINNSWTSGQNATWYAGYTAAWRASGIYPVFAAGNTRGGNLASCSSVQSPGDYADVTAVGATDSANLLATFSAIGPGPDGRLKPDLTAPGSGIWSTVADPAQPYASNRGTSMAAPHVAGAVALLWSANPQLIGDYAATYAALTTAATPATGDSRYLDDAHAACKPLSSPNPIYGHGRLDSYAAVAGVAVDVPWLTLPAGGLPQIASGASAEVRLTLDARRVPGPGTYQARVLVHGPDLGKAPLAVPVTITVPVDAQHAAVSGRVTRALDGEPIQGSVAVAGGPVVSTDAEGRYSITLPPSATPYTLTADARDYVARPRTLQLAAGARATLDFALDADIPRLSADTSARSAQLDFARRVSLPLALGNEGSKVLTYTASVPAELFGVWRSDEPDGPAAAWSDPPADATPLPLTDDGASGPISIGFPFPYVGAIYERVYVSANGVISFAPLAGSNVPFAKSCLPIGETPGPAIAPLRVDLDPSRPGARVSYAALPAGLLISWERVPLYNNPAHLLSFQALLMPDGRISLRYRDVGSLPGDEMASYGIQYGVREVQRLGCGAQLHLDDGLGVELRPQPAATLWLSVAPASGQLPPGGSAPLAIGARWTAPTLGGWPLSGAVVIDTNDPLHPSTRITVRLRSTQAPNRTWFPWLPNQRLP